MPRPCYRTDVCSWSTASLPRARRSALPSCWLRRRRAPRALLLPSLRTLPRPPSPCHPLHLPIPPQLFPAAPPRPPPRHPPAQQTLRSLPRRQVAHLPLLCPAIPPHLPRPRAVLRPRLL